jgi:predicted acylesterase/phospholipase RssA
MPYIIEVFAISDDQYESIEDACSILNQVQPEFEFRIPPQKYRNYLFLHRSDEYQDDEIFKLLEGYRNSAKGHHPFIIAVLDGFLSSGEWANLFGSFDGSSSLAVFTTFEINQFLQDRVRYIRYYLVRYAVSFVAPEIQSHNDANRKYCVFHFKEDKEEILDSLNSGRLCNVCRGKLLPHLTPEIDAAIEAMLKVVCQQHPYSLVVKGGGVKGLAFAGALSVLEKYYSFNCYAGTSAGAIAAVLLGAGYTPVELLRIFGEKNFADFKDASAFGALLNFIRKGGCYPGDSVMTWVNGLLKEKYPERLSKIEMKDLKHTIVYATRMSQGLLIFDSMSIRKETTAAYAARCSMSIPYFFMPMRVDEDMVVDGGARSNFPLKVFMDDYPERPVLALYLKGTEGRQKRKVGQRVLSAVGQIVFLATPGLKRAARIAGDLIDTMIDGEEKKIVDENPDKVIIIDPSPIRTTDFNLNLEKKELLILAGRLGALRFISRNLPDARIDPALLAEIAGRIEEIKKGL